MLNIFSEGEKDISVIEDYHSHNTEQLGIEGMKKLLVKLPLIRKEIFWRRCCPDARIMNQEPNIIQGGKYEDGRGKLTFVNDFNLSTVKRYYIIEHPDVNIVRAWQGHKKNKSGFR